MPRFFITALMLLFLISGCSAPEGNYWKKSGILRVGTDATYPPFETVNTDNRKVEGFDIDVMNRICELNGLKPEYIITPFDGIIAGLKGYKYDCILSAMTITPQRAAIVDFSDSYYRAGQIVAVGRNDSTIRSVDDLTGRMVGVQLGTTGERYAKLLPGVTVVPYENIGAAFIELENGRVDAVLNDYPTTMEYIHLKGTAKTVGDLLSEEHYGIAVRPGDEELLTMINKAIRIMKEDGEFERIGAKWFKNIESIDSLDEAEDSPEAMPDTAE